MKLLIAFIPLLFLASCFPPENKPLCPQEQILRDYDKNQRDRDFWRRLGIGLQRGLDYEQRERFHRNEMAQRNADSINQSLQRRRQPNNYDNYWQEERARQEYYENQRRQFRYPYR